MPTTLHSEAARAMMRKICEEFEVDPGEVTEVEVIHSQVIFHRTPLVYDVPADWSVSVTVEAEKPVVRCAAGNDVRHHATYRCGPGCDMPIG